MGAILSSVTQPYGYTGKDNALLGTVFIVCGVIGTIVISVLLDRYHRFKVTLLATAMLSVCSLIAASLTLPTRKVWLFSVNTAFIGFAGIPAAPVSNAFAVELTFPVPEAISNGMMNILFGFLMGIVSGLICEHWSPIYALAVFALISAVGGAAAIEELRRLRPMPEAPRLNGKSTID
jgi:MFS transporter, FLVCR family, feline leukemia virus subgroup C receptor-related protein